jgi:polar amino acid transport system substrate-binding protein
MKIFFFLFLIQTNCSNAFAETILLKSDKWCPYVCNQANTKDKKQGYVIDIAKVIFERKGHNIVFQLDNWTNSIESVRFGVATAIAATTKADAPDFIYPTKILGSNKECFYVKAKDSWDFITLANLKNRKIGIIESYAYSAPLLSYFREYPNQVVKARGEDPLMHNIANMHSNKIDTIVENPYVFNYFTESRKIRDQYEEAGCTEGDPIYIGFSPKNPRSKEFAKILSDGIEELRKDGTLGKILKKYSLKDWSP